MRVTCALREFVSFESAAGIQIELAAEAAHALANSPIVFLYATFSSVANGEDSGVEAGDERSGCCMRH